MNGKGYSHNKHFTAAIKKYGWSNFEHEIIASNLTKEEAENFEIILIEKLKLRDREFGYNVTTGGEGASGHIATDEAKAKMLDAKRNKYNGCNNPFYNKKHSDESKKKMSESHKGDLSSVAKSVVQLDMEYKFISLWTCISNASRELSISNSGIVMCCKGQRKSSGGFKWMYIEDYEKLLAEQNDLNNN